MDLLSEKESGTSSLSSHEHLQKQQFVIENDTEQPKTTLACFKEDITKKPDELLSIVSFNEISTAGQLPHFFFRE